LPNGKIDSSTLPTPEKDRIEITSQQEPLANVTEVQLEQIWCALLTLEHIGRHEDIFNLGGHSLTLTQLAARINENFGVQVPLTLLFEHRTIEQMAHIILEQLLLALEDEGLH
jgi:acyl carrier protein